MATKLCYELPYEYSYFTGFQQYPIIFKIYDNEFRAFYLSLFNFKLQISVQIFQIQYFNKLIKSEQLFLFRISRHKNPSLVPKQGRAKVPVPFCFSNTFSTISVSLVFGKKNLYLHFRFVSDFENPKTHFRTSLNATEYQQPFCILSTLIFYHIYY